MSQTQVELNENLRAAAEKGDDKKVVEMIQAGADVNYRGGGEITPPLGWAAFQGHLSTVKILLEAGGDIHLHSFNGKTALDYAEIGGHVQISQLLREFIQSKNSDEIIFQRPVSNRTVEEIFDFRTFERMTLIRKTPQGEVEAVTRDLFADVDERVLRKAFNEHLRRGGKTDETLVFPNRLIKAPLRTPRT